MEIFKKGEEKFIRKFEDLHKENKENRKISTFETREKVRHTLDEIKKEIEELPEIKKEEEFHHQMSAIQTINILSQAIEIALNEGVDKGFQFIYQTNNPYLIDSFHDILIAHFVQLLSNKK